MSTTLLGPRYAADGRSLLYLSDVQEEAKRSVERKIRSGAYRFEEAACAVCRGQDFSLLAEKDRCGLPMSVALCNQCGLVQTNPRMTQSSFDEYYNSEYRVLHDRESTAAEAFRREQRRGRLIRDFLRHSGCLPAPLPELSVVEIGCGSGGILSIFREAGCLCQGLDVAGGRLEYGRREHGLALSAGKLRDARFERPPDLVIYAHVLEHVLEPVPELQLLHGILAGNGILYLEVPGIKSLAGTYEDDFLRYLQNAHVYHFSLTSLTNLLQLAGFECLVGDEHVKAVCRVHRGAAAAWRSDREAATASLRDSELRRTAFHPRAALRTLFTRTGLMPLARQVTRLLGR